MARHAPALDRLVERSLHPVAREDHELERVQQALELLAHAFAGGLGAGRLRRAPRPACRTAKRPFSSGDSGPTDVAALGPPSLLSAAECTVVGAIRLLTWNLYHGRAEPSARRPLAAEFAATLAGWEWDVALLQEVPPWWPQPLARGGGRRGAHRR